jgi:hypothetical protein
MNNPFVLRQARHFARRLREEAGEGADPRIRRAYELVFGRPPTAAETNRARAFLREQSEETFCWTLLNSSELAYLR